MSIAWLSPAALIGIALIALPIAIHLLVRQHARTLSYPSLRFLRETQLAAFRRRSIQDAALLVCRVAMVALSAIALAGPVLQTPARQSAYAARTSRAIVTTADGAEPDEIAKAAEGAFASTAITRVKMADGLADAVRWLDGRPASAREIVILGPLGRGDLTGAELSAIDSEIGIRFVATGKSIASPSVFPVLTRRGDQLVGVDRGLRLEIDSTQVTDGAATPVRDDLVRIIAAPGDAALAGAALRAALNAGVPWTNVNQRVVIAWDGAAAASIPDGVGLIRMPVPAPPARAADAVRDVLAKISPPPVRDPVPIAAGQLAAWTRVPGRPSIDAPLADEGDRRWLWGAVLALLALESWMRRSSSAVTSQPRDVDEVRVA